MLYFLLNDPILFVIWIVALVIGITVHEFMHAWMANALGDPTAKFLGRLSINPLKHLDPLGTLLLVLVGFGWGKPVPVNPLRLKWGRWGDILVSVAGILTNLITAAIFALALRFLLFANSHPSAYAVTFLDVVVQVNILLAVFNLVPLPPLDGSKIFLALLPARFDEFKAKFENFGPMILFGIILLERLLNTSILFAIIGPVINFLHQLFIGNSSLGLF